LPPVPGPGVRIAPHCNEWLKRASVLLHPAKGVLPLEHRWGKRVRLHLPVTLYFGTQSVEGRIEDLSSSGAFVATQGRIARWAPLEVHLEANPSGKAGGVMAAYVVRIARHGVGIEWDEHAPTPIRALLSAAAQLEGRPAAASRASPDPMLSA